MNGSGTMPLIPHLDAARRDQCRKLRRVELAPVMGPRRHPADTYSKPIFASARESVRLIVVITKPPGRRHEAARPRNCRDQRRAPQPRKRSPHRMTPEHPPFLDRRHPEVDIQTEPGRMEVRAAPAVSSVTSIAVAPPGAGAVSKATRLRSQHRECGDLPGAKSPPDRVGSGRKAPPEWKAEPA